MFGHIKMFFNTIYMIRHTCSIDKTKPQIRLWKLLIWHVKIMFYMNAWYEVLYLICYLTYTQYLETYLIRFQYPIFRNLNGGLYLLILSLIVMVIALDVVTYLYISIHLYFMLSLLTFPISCLLTYCNAPIFQLLQKIEDATYNLY